MTKEEFLEKINFSRYPKFDISEIHEGDPKEDGCYLIGTAKNHIFIGVWRKPNWYWVGFTSAEGHEFDKSFRQESYETLLTNDMVVYYAKREKNTDNKTVESPKECETIRIKEKRKELAEMVYNNYGGLTEEEKPDYDHEVGAAFQGYVKALQDIEKVIDYASVCNYQFPLLHVRDFIDRMLGRKKSDNNNE